jgi:hypothetical protein
MTILVLCAALSFAASPGFPEASDSTEYVFDESSALEISSADSISRAIVECGPEGSDMRAVRVDLNDDGIPEYMLCCNCGPAGCNYAIVDGQTRQLLGKVSGTRIHVLAQRTHGGAVLEGFTPKGEGEATLVRMVYDGSSYVVDRTDLLTGIGVKWVQDKLDEIPKPPAH